MSCFEAGSQELLLVLLHGWLGLKPQPSSAASQAHYKGARSEVQMGLSPMYCLPLEVQYPKQQLYRLHHNTHLQTIIVETIKTEALV